jgi:hypothetical protein
MAEGGSAGRSTASNVQRQAGIITGIACPGGFPACPGPPARPGDPPETDLRKRDGFLVTGVRRPL